MLMLITNPEATTLIPRSSIVPRTRRLAPHPLMDLSFCETRDARGGSSNLGFWEAYMGTSPLSHLQHDDRLQGGESCQRIIAARFQGRREQFSRWYQRTNGVFIACLFWLPYMICLHQPRTVYLASAGRRLIHAPGSNFVRTATARCRTRGNLTIRR